MGSVVLSCSIAIQSLTPTSESYGLIMRTPFGLQIPSCICSHLLGVYIYIAKFALFRFPLQGVSHGQRLSCQRCDTRVDWSGQESNSESLRERTLVRLGITHLTFHSHLVDNEREGERERESAAFEHRNFHLMPASRWCSRSSEQTDTHTHTTTCSV